MSNKVTKVELFTQVLDYVKDNEELVNFIKHEIDLTKKKNANRSNKPTKTQAENAVLAETLYNAMEQGKAYTITQLLNEVFAGQGFSTSKVSALAQILKSQGKVVRTEEKGKAYYSKV